MTKFFWGTDFFSYRMRFSCRIPQKWLMVSCQRRACQRLWLALKEAARKTRSSGCKQALFWVWVKLLGYCFGVDINNLMGQNMYIAVYLPMEFYNIVYIVINVFTHIYTIFYNTYDIYIYMWYRCKHSESIHNERHIWLTRPKAVQIDPVRGVKITALMSTLD